MIWVGRIVSVPLGVVFFLVLLVTLVVLEFNDTFLDPDFYPEELREAGVYEFVWVDLLNSALDDRRRIESGRASGDLGETPLITSGLSNEDIVSALNRAVPPDEVSSKSV